MKTVIVRPAMIPSALREAIQADCMESSASMNSVICSILGERYGFPVRRSGSARMKGAFSPTAAWVLSIPEPIHDALHAAKVETGGAIGRIIVAVLAEHYGLGVPAIRDQRGQGARDKAGRWVT